MKTPFFTFSLVLIACPLPAESLPQELRVPIPYSFVRSGVQVQVQSVEVVNDGLLVKVSLDETQGQPTEVTLRTMMEARTVRGRLLPYFGYDKDGEKRRGSRVVLAPREKRSVTLVFQRPPDIRTGTPLRLQFRTGKWWSTDDSA